MSLLGRLGLSRTPIVDRNGVPTSRWKRPRVEVDINQDLPQIRSAQPQSSPAQVAAQNLLDAFEENRMEVERGSSQSRYFLSMLEQAKTDEGLQRLNAEEKKGNKLAASVLAAKVADEEGRHYAAALIRSLAQHHQPLGVGRLRAAFDLGNGWVVKVAPSLGGESANAEEAAWVNRDLSQGEPGVQGEGFNDRHPDFQLAECDLVQATDDTSVLLMRKVTPMAFRHQVEVPYWTQTGDNAPDGISKQIGTLEIDGEQVVLGYDL